MKIEEIIEEEQFLWEMAQLTPQMTGLPMLLVVMPKDSVKDRHGPRIKAHTEHNTKFRNDLLTSVSLSSNPKDFFGKLNVSDFKEVRRFILGNLKSLVYFWYKTDTNGEEFNVGHLTNVLRRVDEITDKNIDDNIKWWQSPQRKELMNM